MSSRLKIILASLIAVTFIAVVVVFVLRARSSVQPETAQPVSVPSATLPTNPLPSSPQIAAPQQSAPSPTAAGKSDAGSASVPADTVRRQGFSSVIGIADIPAGALDDVTRTVLSGSARLIAERFGTFSSQNGFQNLRDLQPFMTRSLSAWLDGYIIGLEKNKRSNAYTATSTIALRSSVKEFDASAGHATVVVGASRTDVSGTKNITATQDFEVKFTREQDEWKIDNVRWIR